MTERAKNKRGFVLLFAVSLAGILLAIAVGVTNVAEKEIKFGTSARDTGQAFLAADTGVECAIFHDKSLVSSFPVVGMETSVTCASLIVPLTFYPTANGGIYYFILPGLGNDGLGCAQVSVEKDNVSDSTATQTIIIAKGYNLGDADCESTNASRVERELRVSYSVGNPPSGPPPAAGFPLVKGTAASSMDANSTSHTVALPSAIEAGDLLIVFFSVDDIAAIPQWPANWQPLVPRTVNGDTFEARYKIADGTEIGNIIINTAPRAEPSAHQSFRIVNFSENQNPSAAVITGTSATPDAPEHMPDWGSSKTLWIAAVGRVSGKEVTTDFPANYSNHRSQQAGNADAGTTVDTAVRIFETASENPGPFSVQVSKKWIAATVAIQGEAAP